jgi:hypothetical protein
MEPRLLRLHPSTYQKLIALNKEAERDGALPRGEAVARRSAEF